MNKIVMYTKEQLIPVVEEGSSGFPSESQWVNKMASQFAVLVTNRPLAYRYFGPFWWPLKKIMLDRGEKVAFGEQPDPDELERISFGNTALDIAAAWAHQEYTLERMSGTGNTFTVDTEDGDTEEYVLIDDEMEALQAMKKSLAG